MKTWSGRISLAVLLAGLAGGAGACHKETVIPFPDAGNPCGAGGAGGDAHAIDCAEFPDTTCGAEETTCPRELYGCADASYYATTDYSQCPPEAGPSDATSPSDARLFGDDASADSDATSPTDAALPSDASEAGE